MNLHMNILRNICSLVLLFLVSQNLYSQSIRVRIPDTTAVNGNIIDVPIYLDSSVTGKNIISFELKLNYSINALSLLNIITTGTISSGFSTPNYNINTSSNTINISSAGSTPLSGKGILLYLRFQTNQAGNNGINFTNTTTCFFNQGNPAMTLINGSINISSPPTITAYFSNNNPITVGDSVQVYISGGTAPYTYNTTNASAASISSTGMLRAIGAGKTRVRVQSANLLVDTTNNEIEVRALKLSLPDTTILPVSSCIFPININSTNSSNIVSGSFRINYYQNYLLLDSIITSNTLLQNSSVSFQNFAGYSLISFASSNALTGMGNLIKLRFKILNPQGTGLSIQNIVFNQSLSANTLDGYIRFTPISALYISPNYGEFYTGEFQQFTATGGRQPYTFSVNDTSKASISNAGYFTAKKGGVVKVKVSDSLNTSIQTNDLQVYDALLSMPNIPLVIGTVANYPVLISKLNGQNQLYSVQLTINYDANSIDSIQAILNNSLSSSWSVTQNVLSNKIIIAIAGTTPITTNGILFRLRIKLKSSVSTGTNVYLNTTNVLFNEGNFYAKITNGNINVVSSIQKDIGITSIQNFSSSCTKSNQELITANIYNYSNNTFFIGDTMFVGYKINNNPIVRDTVILLANVSQNNYYQFSFKQKANFSFPSNYTLKVFTMLNGDISNTNDTNINNFQVYGGPNVNLGNDTSFCNGLTKTLNASNVSSTYLWSNSSTASNISVTSSGLYWVKVVSSNGCFSTDTINIIVNPTPNISKLNGLSFSGSCGVDSVLISTSNNTDFKYRWYLNGVVTNNVIDTFNSYLVKSNGTYNVKVVNSFGCSAFMIDTSITLASTRQTPPNIIGNNTICENDTLKLTTSNLPNVSYRWSGPNNFSSSSQNIQLNNASTQITGNYNVYAIKNGASTSCDTSSIINMFVKINSKPLNQSLLINGSLTFCQGDSVTLSVPTQTDYSYRWLRNGTNTANNSDTLNSLVVKTSGTYTVRVTNSTGCFANMRDTIVTVNPKPNTSAITGNSNVLVSSTENYNVINTSGATYNWTVISGTINSGNGTNSISVTWTSSNGAGSVKVFETNANGCKGDTISKSITISTNSDIINLSTNNLNYTASGSTLQVQLTSNRSWTASGQASWITLSPNNGTGNTTLNITASANTSSSIRTNTITFTAGTAIKTLLITQDATVSVSEINKTNYLNIFPNPTSGIVTISSSQAIASIDVFDVTGKLVYSQQYNNKQTNSSLDLFNLSNGIYFIHAKTENGQSNSNKIVITK